MASIRSRRMPNDCRSNAPRRSDPEKLKRYHCRMSASSNRPLDIEFESLRSQIWQQLQRAVSERDHEWRTPVLAGVDTDGLPQARTVVLRQADPIARTLHVYTDARTPKVAELLARPRAALVFWSRLLGWQLRVEATVQVQIEGALVEAAWQQVSKTAAAADYLAPAAPGSVLKTPDDAPANGMRGSHHLAVLIASVDTFDWLALAPNGHRRVRFDESGACRLIP